MWRGVGKHRQQLSRTCLRLCISITRTEMKDIAGFYFILFFSRGRPSDFFIYYFFFFMEFRHRRIFVWKRYQVEALQCSYAFFSGTFDRFLNKWQEKKPLKAAAGRVVIAVCVTKFKVRNLCLPVLSGMWANLFSRECGAVKIIVAPQTYKTFKVNLGKHSCVSGFSIFYSNAFLNREDIHVCFF